MSSKIYYAKPSITSLEEQYIADAIVNGWGENAYGYISRFERMFKEHLGVNFAIATSSCTGALHMGLSALEIGPGDEVIVADTNWIATVAPILYLGAKPVFVDILSDTWCLDPELVEKAITHKTKAIIAVHLYGNLCDMDRLLDIGAKYNIPVIEDAAEGIGSTYKGKRAGTMGVFGTFSFHGSKTVTTGEGGMFVTNNRNLFDKVLTLNNHGRKTTQLKQFWPDIIGYKYKMSNLQAAIGCAQILRIDNLIERKREILNYYRNSFKNLVEISINPVLKDRVSGAWMPTIVFGSALKIDISKLFHMFKVQNIDARSFFYPLSSLPMFLYNSQNVNAYSIHSRAINLPSYHDMTIDDLERVVDIVKNFYKSVT